MFEPVCHTSGQRVRGRGMKFSLPGNRLIIEMPLVSLRLKGIASDGSVCMP